MGAPPPLVFSVDVFATLLARRADDEAVRRGGALRIARFARLSGVPAPADMYAFRQRIEREISAEMIARGLDPEFSHHRVLLTLAQRLGLADPEARASEAASFELRLETALTTPIEETVAWVRDRLRDGARVVAASDTRYSAQELENIFKHHGLPDFSAIYSSADHASSKFSGRLFDLIAVNEGVEPERILHMGDNRAADIFSAAERRLKTKWSRPPRPPPTADPVPDAPHQSANDPAYCLGYEHLGPILAAFARLLLDAAERDGLSHLAFVARDGDLLMKVTSVLCQALPEEERPRLSYLHLSRRALVKPDGETSVVLAHSERVLRYLGQSGVLNDDTALVDIGWAGSTGRLVADFAHEAGLTPPAAFYLGYFNENTHLTPSSRASGLLGDQRRSRGPLEGAAWQIAFLLEAVCRAPHGTVLGFKETPDGVIVPVHACSGAARDSETSNESVQTRVRDGVLAYSHWLANLGVLVPVDQPKVRREAQKRLFRLAFFPFVSEREIARQLVHTETHGDAAGKTLALPSTGGLRGWLAGVRSPWKGAYFMDNGGLPIALLYCVAENLLSALPPGVKPRLARILFPEAIPKVAGMASTTSPGPAGPPLKRSHPMN